MIRFTGIILLLLATVWSCAQQQKGAGGLVDANAFEQLLNSTTDKQVIDVRTADEFATGYISGALNIDFYDSSFTAQLGKLNNEKTVFIYCQGGGRSGKAAETLRQLGFKSVYDLKGGMMAWSSAGKKTETTSAEAISERPQLEGHLYTRQQFDAAISGKLPVLIDFYATWCEPCKRMAPVLTKLSEEYKDRILIVKVDADAAKELCRELKIDGLPLIRTYKNGTQTASRTGFQSESDLRGLIEGILK